MEELKKTPIFADIIKEHTTMLLLNLWVTYCRSSPPWGFAHATCLCQRTLWSTVTKKSNGCRSPSKLAHALESGTSSSIIIVECGGNPSIANLPFAVLLAKRLTNDGIYVISHCSLIYKVTNWWARLVAVMCLQLGQSKVKIRDERKRQRSQFNNSQCGGQKKSRSKNEIQV